MSNNHDVSIARSVALITAMGLLTVVASAACGESVSTLPLTTTTYRDPRIDDPMGIITGPDGALWFINHGDHPSVGRITTTGKMRFYTGPELDDVHVITSGSDGAIWFIPGTANEIGRLNTDGKVRIYRDPRIGHTKGITSGPNGSIWFTAEWYRDPKIASIGRIDRNGKVVIYSHPKLNFVDQITAGPDGALWFLAFSPSRIVRVTTAGKFRFYRDEVDDPSSITAGPDGALWFTTSHSTVGRITTSGHPERYGDWGHEGQSSYAITAAPDALWFTDALSGSIGRMQKYGEIDRYADESFHNLTGIAVAPDRSIWFTNTDDPYDSVGFLHT